MLFFFAFSMFSNKKNLSDFFWESCHFSFKLFVSYAEAGLNKALDLPLDLPLDLALYLRSGDLAV